MPFENPFKENDEEVYLVNLNAAIKFHNIVFVDYLMGNKPSTKALDAI
jgi:hypothetical protein